jgi:hypothetical protein
MYATCYSEKPIDFQIIMQLYITEARTHYDHRWENLNG